ncbi:DUF3347 domain-containing protein [Flavihumibacter sp. ZG627]|uniref:DUF3347 domain-containing protein n=1 Tax=Flavihumibacter sp. ZG627 TaxID=1463156 RepID=UPI00069340E1|nr:DUF3347 domain-containing protein [Flavihumibacter sp. ZG627]
MKKALLIVLVFSILLLQKATAQDSSFKVKSQLSSLINSWQLIKDALAEGSVDEAAFAASAYIKIANGIDYKLLSEGNIHALLKDAGAISEAPDLKRQQKSFEQLSANMVTLAKAFKLEISVGDKNQ